MSMLLITPLAFSWGIGILRLDTCSPLCFRVILKLFQNFQSRIIQQWPNNSNSCGSRDRRTYPLCQITSAIKDIGVSWILSWTLELGTSYKYFFSRFTFLEKRKSRDFSSVQISEFSRFLQSISRFFLPSVVDKISRFFSQDFVS
jgi:hypothetical protein